MWYMTGIKTGKGKSHTVDFMVHYSVIKQALQIAYIFLVTNVSMDNVYLHMG